MMEGSWVNRKKYEETTVSREKVFEGKFISVYVEHVLLPDGRRATRDIVRHPGAVAVLALDGDRMIVVEQYRKALERSQVEIPAGKLDPGEDPMEAAKRELLEETGYTARDIRHLCSFSTSPGFADEILHLYVAEGLARGDARPDEDEFLDCFAVTLDEAKRMIREGRIGDAKTVTAVLAWQAYRLTGSFL